MDALKLDPLEELAALELFLGGVVARQSWSEHVCCAVQPETANGSPEDLTDTDEGARILGTWADRIERALEGVQTEQDILSRLATVSLGFNLREFSDHIEQQILQGALLGAADVAWELEQDEEIAPAKFAWRGHALLLNAPLSQVPYADALAAFQKKRILPKATFDALKAGAKRQAFTVANMASQEMLATVHAELARQMAEAKDATAYRDPVTGKWVYVGTNLREFSKFAKERLVSAGWTPASPTHVETIFRTNVLGAYGSGRFIQQKAVESVLPYWQIRTVKDARQRPTHKAADGIVLPASHGFWKKAYPPFGYNCRCKVTARTAGWLKRTGTKVGYAPKNLPDPGFDAGTKALIQVPITPVEAKPVPAPIAAPKPAVVAPPKPPQPLWPPAPMPPPPAPPPPAPPLPASPPVVASPKSPALLDTHALGFKHLDADGYQQIIEAQHSEILNNLKNAKLTSIAPADITLVVDEIDVQAAEDALFDDEGYEIPIVVKSGGKHYAYSNNTYVAGAAKIELDSIEVKLVDLDAIKAKPTSKAHAAPKAKPRVVPPAQSKVPKKLSEVKSVWDGAIEAADEAHSDSVYVDVSRESDAIRRRLSRADVEAVQSFCYGYDWTIREVQSGKLTREQLIKSRMKHANETVADATDHVDRAYAYARSLTEFVSVAPGSRHIDTVYRGLGGVSPTVVKKMLADGHFDMRGQTSSTSRSPAVAWTFIESNAEYSKVNVLLRLKTKKAVPIETISTVPDEYELLLRGDSKFNITRVDKHEGPTGTTYVIHGEDADG